MPKSDPFPAVLKISTFSDDFPKIKHFWDLLLNKSIVLLGGISPRLYNIFFLKSECFAKLNQMPYKCLGISHWGSYFFNQICNLIRFVRQDLFSIKPCWLALITSCPFILYQLNPIFYYFAPPSPPLQFDVRFAGLYLPRSSCLSLLNTGKTSLFFQSSGISVLFQDPLKINMWKEESPPPTIWDSSGASYLGLMNYRFLSQVDI